MLLGGAAVALPLRAGAQPQSRFPIHARSSWLQNASRSLAKFSVPPRLSGSPFPVEREFGGLAGLTLHLACVPLPQWRTGQAPPGQGLLTRGGVASSHISRYFGSASAGRIRPDSVGRRPKTYGLAEPHRRNNSTDDQPHHRNGLAAMRSKRARLATAG